MFNRRHSAILCILIGVLTACNLSSSVVSNDAPTAIDSVTSQPEVIVVTATFSPTSTPSTNVTPTQSGSGTTRPVVNDTGSSTAPQGYVVNLPAPALACSVTPNDSVNVNIRSGQSTNSGILGTLTAASWVNVRSVNNGWYQVSYPNTPVDGAWISASVVNLTQPCQCNDFACTASVTFAGTLQGTCSIMATVTTNVRSGPGTQYARINQITAGSTVAAVGTSNTGWFLMDFGAYTGWADASLFQRSADCALPVQGAWCLTNSGSNPVFTCGVTALTTVNIRSGPGTQHTILTQVTGGVTVNAIAISDNSWYQVQANGTVGWADAGIFSRSTNCNLPPVPTNPSGNACWVVPNGNFTVAIRAGASTQYNVVGQIPGGSQANLAGNAGNGWWQVEYNSTIGYVDGQTIRMVRPNSLCDNPFPLVNGGVGVDPSGCAVRANGNNAVPIYTGPGSENPVIDYLQPGLDTALISGQYNGWYRIGRNGGTGWIARGQIITEGPCGSIPIILDYVPIGACTAVNTTAEVQPIFNTPNPAAGEVFIARFHPGMATSVHARSNGWARVYIAAFNNYGWIAENVVTLAGPCDGLPSQ